MSSESYKRFLRSQARKRPVRVGKTSISWEERERGPSSGSAANLLESVYLGREPKDTVVVDREAAMVLQERLTGLEGEVDRLHRRLRIMKWSLFALLGLAAASLSFLLWVLLGMPA